MAGKDDTICTVDHCPLHMHNFNGHIRAALKSVQLATELTDDPDIEFCTSRIYSELSVVLLKAKNKERV